MPANSGGQQGLPLALAQRLQGKQALDRGRLSTQENKMNKCMEIKSPRVNKMHWIEFKCFLFVEEW